MVIFFNEKGEVKFQIIKYNDMFYELQVIDNMLNEQLHLTKNHLFNNLLQLSTISLNILL